MNELAITVIGHDRPGIVADVAEVLASLGINLTDTTMTRLRGHFAMTLICTGEASAEAAEAALRPLREQSGGSLLATVRDVGQEPDVLPAGTPYLVSVHGADRLGIVAAVTRVLAQAGGNVTDLSTRLVGSLYTLVAEVDLPAGAADAVTAELARTAGGLGVDVTVRPAETDVL